MNGTSNHTASDTESGLIGAPLFLVVLTATSAWCVFIMCIVCCSEYRGYQRRGLNRFYDRGRAAGTELKSYRENEEGVPMGASSAPTIQQDLSTIPSDDITDSSIDKKDDIFNDHRETIEATIDFPTPKTRKSILPPINVGTIINVESKCHSDSNSPSKEVLLDSSSRRQKSSHLPPVFVDS